MHTIRLTQEQAQAAGKDIMADARCNDDAKRAIRAGLVKSGADMLYTCTAAVLGENQWYDLVMAEHGSIVL